MTFSESILALSVLFIAAGVLLPFCMELIAETDKRMEQQEGMRKLYEEAESKLFTKSSFVYNLDQPNFKGQLIWQEANGKDKACVLLDQKKRCVTEQ